MKNILILLFVSLAMIACGGEENSSKSKNNSWGESDKDCFREQKFQN